MKLGLAVFAAILLFAPGWLLRASGFASLGALLFAALPISRALRREAGIAAALLATAHLGAVLVTGYYPLGEALLTEAHARAGLASWLCLAVLFATSSGWRPRRVGILFRAGDLAILLALHHAALSPHARVEILAVTLGAAALALGARRLPRARAETP